MQDLKLVLVDSVLNVFSYSTVVSRSFNLLLMDYS